MAGRMKTGLVLAGLLASCVALGTGCKRAEAEARPQDLLQQQQDEGTRDRSGTGGTGTTQDEDTLDEPGTGGSFDQGTADEDMMDEPGTGGAGEDTVREEDEGVLQPGVRDEGLDHDEGQADEDTVYQGTRQPPED